MVLGQQRAIGLDALPEPLHPPGVAGLEVAHGVGDRARQAHGVDVATGEAARFHHLRGQLVAVQLLDRPQEALVVEPLDVDDLRLHRPLQIAGQRVHRLHGILAPRPEVGAGLDRLAEGHQHPAAERLARLEREPDRDHRQLARVLGLVGEREASGARLDALHARLGVRRALRIDRHQPALRERRLAGGERVDVALGVGGVVLAAVDRDGAAGQQ